MCNAVGDICADKLPHPPAIVICGSSCMDRLEYVSSKKLVCYTPTVVGPGEIIIATYSGGIGKSTVTFIGLAPEQESLLGEGVVRRWGGICVCDLISTVCWSQTHSRNLMSGWKRSSVFCLGSRSPEQCPSTHVTLLTPWAKPLESRGRSEQGVRI